MRNILLILKKREKGQRKSTGKRNSFSDHVCKEDLESDLSSDNEVCDENLVDLDEDLDHTLDLMRATWTQVSPPAEEKDIQRHWSS